jgi:hypothetical protein
MIVRGTNIRNILIPKEFLIKQALKSSENDKAQGIASLVGFFLLTSNRNCDAIGKQRTWKDYKLP